MSKSKGLREQVGEWDSERRLLLRLQQQQLAPLRARGRLLTPTTAAVLCLTGP